MKPSAVKARREKLAELYSQTGLRVERFRALGSLASTKYFRDGLEGKHPFPEPALTEDEYRKRVDYFAPANREKVASLLAQSVQLPNSNGQRWYTPFDARVGIIADEFLAKSFTGTAELVHVTPSTFEADLQRIDILLVTTAWRGQGNEWSELPKKDSATRQLLVQDIIPMAQSRGIPVIFYSKEDPPNFVTFVDIAVHCDAILTSAEESCGRYAELVPSDVPIDVLPFGVSHAHHNPMGCMRFRERIWSFAGSWHNHKYPGRRSAGQRIFTGVIDSGQDLLIFDRNFALSKERYRFPEWMVPYLHPSIPHDDLLNLQRMLPVAINLNSVQNSQTMFANRAIELQAMGTFVLSNYNAGLNSQFPHIRMPDTEVDVATMIQTLTEVDVVRAQLDGVRSAFNGNTAFDRMGKILDVACELAGVSPAARATHRVLISADDSERFANFVDGQTGEANLEFVTRDQLSNRVGGANGDVYIDIEDRPYPRTFVQDLINGFKFADVDQVQSVSAFGSSQAFEFAAANSTAASAATWVREGVPISEAAVAAQTAVSVGEAPHAEAREILLSSIQYEEPEVTVVVPVYNNGDHLVNKCFASLRRSSIFAKMRVLLIDDGSTKEDTVEAVRSLAELYPNVEAHFLGGGGSGSASRPRNYGLEIAATPFITYLDPDNEATADGYAVLLEQLKRDSELEFAIGDMLKYRGSRAMVQNVNLLKNVVDDEGALTDDAIVSIKFQPMSIQALVARTSWLQGIGIKQPVGAVGQDSYFFQQMLYYASKIGLTKLPIHCYYAEVANSTVNSVGPRFYEKYLPLVQARSAWLEEVGLLQEYKDLRLEPFVKGWFINKLKYVADDQVDRCKELIREIASYYEPHEWKDPELKEFFQPLEADAENTSDPDDASPASAGSVPPETSSMTS